MWHVQSGQWHATQNPSLQIVPPFKGDSQREWNTFSPWGRLTCFLLTQIQSATQRPRTVEFFLLLTSNSSDPQE